MGCFNWKHDALHCFQRGKKDAVKGLQKRKKVVEDEEIASDSDIEKSVISFVCVSLLHCGPKMLGMRESQRG